MRRAILLLCFFEMACAHRYVISLANQSERDCEALSLSGDSLLCRSSGSVAAFGFDSIRRIERKPRLAGTLVVGGLGATAGFFVGAVFGAIWALVNLASSPEPYVLIPSIAGGALGFLAGKSLWAMLDEETLYPQNFSPDQRKRELQNFIK
ncbi:MAG: hypothetical protein NZM06_09910 [Chloroherpetonaceae bacterium]|nr:hypothetical protein [Chloroherpetonaceae bacterium]MDW8437735.1 hypothetical protein [Chloroherpetonaceae bacterium]